MRSLRHLLCLAAILIGSQATATTPYTPADEVAEFASFAAVCQPAAVGEIDNGAAIAPRVFRRVQLRWVRGVADTSTQANQTACNWTTIIPPAKVLTHTQGNGTGPFVYGLPGRPLTWEQRQYLYVEDATGTPVEYALEWAGTHWRFRDRTDPTAPSFPAGMLRIGGHRPADGPWGVGSPCRTIANGGGTGGWINYRQMFDIPGTTGTAAYQVAALGPYYFGTCYVARDPADCAWWPAYPCGFFGLASLPETEIVSWSQPGASLQPDSAGVWLIGYPRLFTVRSPADMDQSGGRSVEDVYRFLQCWTGRDPRADFDDDRAFTVADVFAFLSRWFDPA